MKMTGMVLLAVAVFSAVPHAETVVNIEDPGLEAALREALKKPGAPLLAEDLAAVTALDASRRGIVSLAGIEACAGLERLDLSMNQIGNITPLSRLTRLRQLVLRRNRITDLAPLAALHGLTELDFSANRVSSLAPLAGLAALERLAARDNRIEAVTPLQGLTRLTQLGLGRNPLRDASPLAGLSRLTHLGLTQTFVAHIAFLESMPALRRLSLRECPLSQQAYCQVIPALVARNVVVDTPEGCGKDADGDGLTASYEALVKTRPEKADSDEDGLLDGEEIAAGTDPLRPDTDDDGMPDGWEHRHNLNPLVPDADVDTDGDGMDNMTEFEYQTDPNNPSEHPLPAKLLVDVDAVTLRKDNPFALFHIEQEGDIPIQWTLTSSDYHFWVTDPPGAPGTETMPAGIPAGLAFTPDLYERVEGGTGPRTLAVRTDSFTEEVKGAITITNAANPDQKALLSVHLVAHRPGPPKTFVLTAMASPEEGGTVFLDPSGGHYAPGTVVSVGALAAKGFVFDHWQGTVADSQAPSTTITLESDTALIAFFTPEPRGFFGCHAVPLSPPVSGGGEPLTMGIALLALLLVTHGCMPSIHGRG